MLNTFKNLIIAVSLVFFQVAGAIPLEDIKELDLTNEGYGDLNPLHGLVWNEGILENHGELLPEGNTLRKIIMLLYHRTGTFDPSTQPDTNSVVPYLTPEVIGNINGALKQGKLEIDKIVKVPGGPQYAIPRKYRNNLGTWLNELRNDPKAYRVMLSLLWSKAQSKRDFEEYYQGVRAWNSDAVKRIPEGWLISRFTENDAQSAKPPAIEKYDAYLYWMMKRLSNAAPLEHQATSYVPESLADCGETSLKNFLKLAIDQNGTYNVNVLKALGAKQNVIDFFVRFPNRQEQATQAARNAWAQVTINLENVVYKQNINGKKFEIRASTTNPSENMLAALRALFAKLKDVHAWEEVGQKIEEARRQAGLSNFQIENTDLSTEGKGQVSFTVGKLGRFVWYFQSVHFYIDALTDEEIGDYPKTDNQDIAVFYKPVFYKSGRADDNTWYFYCRWRLNERISWLIHTLANTSRLDMPKFVALFNRLTTDDAKERVLMNSKFEKLVLELFAHKDFSPSATYLPAFALTRQFKLARKLLEHKYFVEDGAYFLGHGEAVLSAVFSHDGTKVLTASLDESYRIWNAKTGESIGYKSLEVPVLSAVFSTDGTKILARTQYEAHIFDAETNQEIRKFSTNPAEMRSARFNQDGTKVVTACNDKTARIWDAETGKEIVTLKGHSGVVNSAVFSRDGTKVVTASDDKTARIWNAATGKEIRTLNGHTGSVKSAIFSPDDLRVLTGSVDKTARIWNTGTGKEMKAISGDSPMTSAVFDRYGERVLTLSAKKAQIWSGTTGKEVRVLEAPSILTSAVFSPDNKSVLTSSADRIARIWR